MIVLGIDPSLCNTGLAAVELLPDGERVLETFVVRTAPSPKRRHVLVADDDARRAAELAAGLDSAIARHHPVALVVEAPSGSKGARAGRALGLAFGAVVAVAKLRALPLVQVQPFDVKRAMVGRKSAEKDEIILAVERRFPETAWPEPESVWEHAADAVGAVVAALDTETLRLARKLSGRRAGGDGGVQEAPTGDFRARSGDGTHEVAPGTTRREGAAISGPPSAGAEASTP